MNKPLYQIVALALVCALTLQTLAWADPSVAAITYFEKVKLLTQEGKKVKKMEVALRFVDDRLIVFHKDKGDLKIFPYSSIQKAEYANAKNLPPQFITLATHASFWHEGSKIGAPDRRQPILAHRRLGSYNTEAPKLLGLVGGAMFLVAGLIVALVSSGGEKHWLIIQSQENYAVLQLDKSNYKPILSTLETRTGVRIEAIDNNESQK